MESISGKKSYTKYPYKISLKQIIYPILALLVTGCGNNERQLINRLYLKNIDFDGLYVVCDSTFKSYTPNSKIKIVSYIDSLMCDNCLCQDICMASRFLKPYQDKNVEFVFILQKPPTRLIHEVVSELNNPNIVVIVDDNGVFIKTNHLQTYPQWSLTFLLSEDNKIAIIGNPAKNTKVHSLYNKRIQLLTKNPKPNN